MQDCSSPRRPLWGFGAVTLMRALRPAISQTAAWHAMAGWILSLAGA
jgi:hypothetical protein